MKAEALQHEPIMTRDQMRQTTFEYIEVDYNRTRRHGALGYLSPVHFEQQNVQKRVYRMAKLTSMKLYSSHTRQRRRLALSELLLPVPVNHLSIFKRHLKALGMQRHRGNTATSSWLVLQYFRLAVILQTISRLPNRIQ